MKYRPSISKDEINELPRYTFSGDVKLIESEEAAIKAVKELEGERVLGFDTETRAAFKKGESYDVSMLQLATKDAAYLFRLNKIPLLPELADILANPEVVKAGVAIKDDVKGLQKLRSFRPQNFVDLADVARDKKIKNFGLRGLTAIVLGKRLSKKAKISNWERKSLTPAQIDYAACDGAIGYAIFCDFFDV